MRKIVIFLVLSSAILLTGCGPIYKREYAYVPPHSKMGGFCISQCIQNQTMCEQMSQMNVENCRARSERDAYPRYNAYVNERIAKGKPIKRTVNDFNYDFCASNTLNCKTAFNTCYTACGGQILEHKECIAFCNNKS